MKTHILILITLLSIILTGCNVEKYTPILINSEIDEEIERYVNENELNIIIGTVGTDEEAMMLENPDKIGLVVLNYNSESDSVTLKDWFVNKSEATNDIIYSQLPGEDGFYIGVVVLDEETVYKTTSFKVNFTESSDSLPYAIQQTTNGSKVLIFYYEGDVQREIESIELISN